MGTKLSTQSYVKARYRTSNKRPSAANSHSASHLDGFDDKKQLSSSTSFDKFTRSQPLCRQVSTAHMDIDSRFGHSPGELDEDRMNATHFALKALFGANFLNTVQQTIDFDSKSTRVLDIGCGTGTWIMDMATEFPNTEFVGIDRVHIFPAAIRPPNATFKLVDVRDGLPFEDNTFDLVNTRLFLLDLTATLWPEFLKEVLRITKPGGILQMMELQVMDEGDEVVQEFCSRMEQMMLKEDLDPRICEKMGNLISKNGFIPKEEVAKAVPLKGHVLSDEFVYVLDIIFDIARLVAYNTYDLSSESEYQSVKKRYIQSRKQSTDVKWWWIAGQKPMA
ncbi:S-adenosyl-L-methionine-dependent methyltransferase [Choanephora cucurbitarum]|nr:S-adenosyl-L-methionine-dependent methyltransferase [Choanephora cucurbitarum]